MRPHPAGFERYHNAVRPCPRRLLPGRLCAHARRSGGKNAFAETRNTERRRGISPRRASLGTVAAPRRDLSLVSGMGRSVKKSSTSDSARTQTPRIPLPAAEANSQQKGRPTRLMTLESVHADHVAMTPTTPRRRRPTAASSLTNTHSTPPYPCRRARPGTRASSPRSRGPTGA